MTDLTAAEVTAIAEWTRAHPDEALVILREAAVRWPQYERHYRAVVGFSARRVVRELRRLRRKED